jgi:hypothetical protein
MELTTNHFRVQLVAVALAGVMLLSGFSCNSIPSWVTTALDALPALIQSIGTLRNLITGLPADAETDAILTEIATEAQQDLQLIQTAYTQYEQDRTASNQQKIINAINLINTNLNQIMAAVHIKDAALLQKIKDAVQMVLEAVNYYEGLIPAAKVFHMTRPTNTLILKRPSAAYIRKVWNERIAQGDSRLIVK